MNWCRKTAALSFRLCGRGSAAVEVACLTEAWGGQARLQPGRDIDEGSLYRTASWLQSQRLSVAVSPPTLPTALAESRLPSGG